MSKLAAEGLCRLRHLEHRPNCVILRTARLFPEEADTHRDLPGPNLKANEFLYRRLTLEDAAAAHVAELERTPELGFDTLVISAPTPFAHSDVQSLRHDAAGVVARYFPDAPAIYARTGRRLPARIGRVYDASRGERVLGFRCNTDFAAILEATQRGEPAPFAHDPNYLSLVTAAPSPWAET